MEEDEENGRSSVTLQERVERAMQVTLSREMDKLERHMGFLASLGSTATFIGLFGTVWGIMNSFQCYCRIPKYEPCRCSSWYC